MEETFREMERAAFEQTQVEHMRAAMRCVLLRANLLSLLLVRADLVGVTQGSLWAGGWWYFDFDVDVDIALSNLSRPQKPLSLPSTTGYTDFP